MQKQTRQQLAEVPSQELWQELLSGKRIKKYAFTPNRVKRSLHVKNMPKDFRIIVDAPTMVMAMEAFDILFPGFSSYDVEQVTKKGRSAYAEKNRNTERPV